MRPHSMYRWELVCHKWEVTPRSAESSFCVVGTSASVENQRMLEKDAQLLIGATDAVGSYSKMQRRGGAFSFHSWVTNAKLSVIRTIQGPYRSIQGRCQWVRFKTNIVYSGSAGENGLCRGCAVSRCLLTKSSVIPTH